MTRNELIKAGYLTWNENWELLYRKWRIDIWVKMYYRRWFNKSLTFNLLKDRCEDSRIDFIQIKKKI